MIRGVRFIPYALPLRHKWTVSKGAASCHSGWIAALFISDGRVGFGDCPADVPGHGRLTCDRTRLDALAAGIVGSSVKDALDAFDSPGLGEAALECALWDAMAQANGAPLRMFFNPDAKAKVEINSVQPIDQLTKGGAFRTIKIKVGVRPIDEEIALLRQARLDDGVRLRLDANGAWDFDQACFALDSLADAPIESLEEPLADPDIASLQALQERTMIALAIDESIMALGPETLIESRAVRRLVLKLGAIGGFAATFELAKKAAAAGLDCVVTSRLESSVGILAAAHLAAALGGDCAHGLGTASWLAKDVCPSPPIIDGFLHLDDRPGLGVERQGAFFA